MSNQDSGTTPSDATRAEEKTEAAAPHQPDRPPTGDEERAAPSKAGSETKQSFEEMAERGANVKGEGELP